MTNVITSVTAMTMKKVNVGSGPNFANIKTNSTAQTPTSKSMGPCVQPLRASALFHCPFRVLMEIGLEQYGQLPNKVPKDIRLFGVDRIHSSKQVK